MAFRARAIVLFKQLPPISTTDFVNLSDILYCIKQELIWSAINAFLMYYKVGSRYRQYVLVTRASALQIPLCNSDDCGSR